MKSKTSLYKGLIALIAILTANIGIFVLVVEKTVIFWMCYAFLMIAFLLMTYINIFYADKQKLIFGYTVAAITTAYVVVEVIAALLFMFVLKYQFMLAFLTQVVILAVYGIAFIQTIIINDEIKNQQAERNVDIANFKYILENMKAVQRKVEYAAPYRKTLEHAYDSLASGQVRSTPEVSALESSILELIQKLDKAVEVKEEAAIIDICRQIESYSEDRKQKLRQRANF